MFFYDAHCAFCVWSLDRLLTMTTDLPTAPGKGLYIQRNAYFIDSDERVYLGHRAIGRALQLFGRTRAYRRLGQLLQLPVFAPVYRVIVWNRGRIGALVGVKGCRIPR
ncbi:hypothetical protein [Corynebacterium sp. H130]|uniref:hypothetical protein n=1 Tax=Corynebacterium sp. H130 TaxID=3133444 RepID=UPI0030A5B0AB